jgi:ATP-dependent helicase HepA
MVIVDEAHHLHWQEGAPSAEYELVESLARSAPAAMLLTATPEQLGRAGHFGRLRLLDPDRFHDYQTFVHEEEGYADVAVIAGKLLDDDQLTPAENKRLQGMLGTDAAGDAHDVISRLVDRHGTGRVLFRNTRQAISGFPTRSLATYRLELPDAYAAQADQLTPERDAGPDWPAWDPRVAWLVGLARDLAPEKVLVICARAETALALREYLQEKVALRTGVFHEHMDLVARDRAAAFFADPDAGAQLLLCSEIGSEGRNFQFVHHLVMFDLPLDPELLEQRIGRLDRIGQREAVHLHVPYLAGSAAEVLLQWYRDGLGSFEAICPAAPAVHAALGDQLIAAIEEPEKLPALLVEVSAMTRRVNAELEAGRDRLLEMHSHQPLVASRLVEALQRAEAEHAVLPFLTTFWDAFGLEHEPGPGRSVVLREGSHMLSEHFPGLLPGGMTVTFQRDDALDHEDRQFLTWEHPMTRGCLDLLTSGPLGGVALTVCEHADFPTGSVLYEALFVVDTIAPAELGLRRFLPPTAIRLLLDVHGEDLAARLPHDQLHGLCIAGNRKLADTVVRSQQAKLGLLQQRAEELAGQQALAIVDRARHAASAELDDEYRRLKALAKVNPNVRESELNQIAARRERIDVALDDVRLRFDALRLVVMR